jgi:signal transduction histidine kinase
LIAPAYSKNPSTDHLDAVVTITQAQAAPAQLDQTTPPSSGWRDVQLPDNWSERLPDHNGAMWYRMQWQADSTQNVVLFVPYVAYAGAFYVNGALLSSSASMVEPLSHEWNRPRLVHIPSAALRVGSNELVVHTAGYSAMHSGLPALRLGSVAIIRPLYDRENLIRLTPQVLNAAIALAWALLFMAIWWLRKKDSLYGWFTLSMFFWLGYNVNFVITEPFWPFGTSLSMDIAATVCVLAYFPPAIVFLQRMLGKRARWELLVWAAMATSCSAVVLAPQSSIGSIRSAALTGFSMFYTLYCLHFMWVTARQRHRANAPIALCLCIPLGLGMHDILELVGFLPQDYVFWPQTGVWVFLMGAGIALAWRYSASLASVESLNATLGKRVQEAVQKLSYSTSEKYRSEVNTIRAEERLSLARDMHDGFGGMLTGTIAAMEHQKTSSAQVLSELKEMRADLRMMLDATYQSDDVAFPNLIGPLRRRLTDYLNNAGIALRWELSGTDNLYLGTAMGLSVQRLLREGLTNTMRHSRATHASCGIAWDGAILRILIHDNGQGLANSQLNESKTASYGLTNLRARANQLDGTLEVDSTDLGTQIRFTCPCVSVA